ncbi:hypothetical protein EW146_g3250 [Bondarzewia mesenterica]|uniref:F-box domain-containing protein n=1 Tax=Bondarzewia mesenterica TaxID=1095465 RepID=A0A4S4M0C5_9AGAM|nr:hypothetical protein EW146_g3250 [Bondarzewia mesenterica]
MAMMSTPMNPPLPAELVHHILRFSAASSTSSCLTLCLVSSWVHDLAIPYLFSQVILTIPARAHAFRTRVIRSTNPTHDAANPLALIHNLWVSSNASVNFGVDILCKCPNLRHAAIDIQSFSTLLSVELPPQESDECDSNETDLHLTLFGSVRQNTQYPSRSAFTAPILERITHLHLLTGSLPGPSIYLPRLTHLAMCFKHNHSFMNFVNTTLTSQSLQVLVLIVDTILAPFVRRAIVQRIGACRQKDERVWFVEIDMCQFDQDWVEEANGGETIWEKAVRQTTVWEKNREVLAVNVAASVSSMAQIKVCDGVNGAECHQRIELLQA